MASATTTTNPGFKAGSTQSSSKQYRRFRIKLRKRGRDDALRQAIRDVQTSLGLTHHADAVRTIIGAVGVTLQGRVPVDLGRRVRDRNNAGKQRRDHYGIESGSSPSGLPTTLDVSIDSVLDGVVEGVIATKGASTVAAAKRQLLWAGINALKQNSPAINAYREEL